MFMTGENNPCLSHFTAHGLFCSMAPDVLQVCFKTPSDLNDQSSLSFLTILSPFQPRQHRDRDDIAAARYKTAAGCGSRPQS